MRFSERQAAVIDDRGKRNKGNRNNACPAKGESRNTKVKHAFFNSYEDPVVDCGFVSDVESRVTQWPDPCSSVLSCSGPSARSRGAAGTVNGCGCGFGVQGFYDVRVSLGRCLGIDGTSGPAGAA